MVVGFPFTLIWVVIDWADTRVVVAAKSSAAAAVLDVFKNLNITTNRGARLRFHWKAGSMDSAGSDKVERRP